MRTIPTVIDGYETALHLRDDVTPVCLCGDEKAVHDDEGACSLGTGPRGLPCACVGWTHVADRRYVSGSFLVPVPRGDAA